MSLDEKHISIAKKLRRARQTIEEVHNHLQFRYFNTAINRIYYASFYAAQALLLSIDLVPKSHKGVRTLFLQHFVKEKKIPPELEKFYTRIFDERQFADYMDTEIFDEEAILYLFEQAKDFIRHIEIFLQEK